jgi:hypothetical protein
VAAALRALEALRTLHGLTIRTPEGAFSHGDATARNCLYDPAAGAARWFDFETAHDPQRPPAWRRADDVRALAFSARRSLSPGAAEALADRLTQAYPDPDMLQALDGILAELEWRADPFHLAQAQLTQAESRAWTARLRQALRRAA